MMFVSQFIVVIALVGSSLASVDPVYNVTSSIEDYTLLVGRNMQINLDLRALELATVKVRHADRIESIENQQHLVMQELQQFDQSMLQQQALSLSRKHCVQKYKRSAPTVDEVDRNFTYCLYDAEMSADTLTSSAALQLSRMTSIRQYDVPKIFPTCNSTYSTESQVADCVTEQVDLKVSLFNTYMDQFDISLQQSLYSSSIIATEATRCSFSVEKKVLAANGAVLSLSDACEDEFKDQGKTQTSLSERDVLERKLMERLRLGSNPLNRF